MAANNVASSYQYYQDVMAIFEAMLQATQDYNERFRQVHVVNNDTLIRT